MFYLMKKIKCHLQSIFFFENGKFMVNSRDERSYVIGKTFEFSDLSEAKLKFLKLLDLTIEINKEDIKLFS
ncbi:Imm59 family immunity protein [Listeria marthii]|uniref:Imm59 family immunity protein n=1 Tax=Listeria marthii TaxID=529731 RepID=UPI00289DF30D|nr:Imm59 family immunity protein [Listeria marthii]